MKDGTAAPLAEAAPSKVGGIGARVVSGLIALPPVLAAIHFGSPAFPALVGAGVIILWWEWCHLCGRSVRSPASVVGGAVVLAAVVATALQRPGIGLTIVAAGGILALAWAMVVGDKTGNGRSARSWSGSRWIALGVVYIGFPTLLLVWLRDAAGAVTVFWLFALVWATDTGAYAFGRLIGGPKLAPRISPTKTWAGLAGGVVCAAGIGATFAALPASHAFGPLAALSGALAVIAQVGDLFESGVKRHFGVKDAGGIMPGLGGLLVRVDGLLTAVVAAALIALLDRERILVWL